MGLHIGNSFSGKIKLLVSSLVLTLAIVAQPYVNVLPAFAVTPTVAVVEINNTVELEAAIANQQANQIWNIHAADYALVPNTTIFAGGQTGWMMPITADNITINGIGNPTIYGNQYRTNGAWATQDLVAVFGNNVTVNGVTLMPSTDNKTLEVIGNDFTFTNSTITPNTKIDAAAYNVIADAGDRAFAQQWGGSLYFNHAGNHVISNVTLNNGGVSYRYSPIGTNITFTNVDIVHTTNITDINAYRYSSGFNEASNTVTGSPVVTYHVSAALNNLDSVVSSAQAGDIISIDSDLTLNKAVTLTKAVTINGNSHTINAPFAKTGTANDNNAAFIILSNGVEIKNATVKGIASSTLHGVNIYEVTGVSLNNVTVENFRSGVVVNGSSVNIADIHTSGNTWHGINVDKAGAHLTISGANSHSEVLPIYIDDTTTGATVTDSDSQYVYSHKGLQPNDRVYTLRLAAPTNLTLTASPSNTPITNNGYTASANVVAGWVAVPGADHYKYKYWNSISTSAYNSSNPYVVNVNGTSQSGTFNQGEGIHHFSVSACDASDVCSFDSATFNVTFDQTKPAGLSHSSPVNGTYGTTASLTSIDWSDATDAIGPVSYYYESSTSNVLKSDKSFAMPIYQSGALSSSNIPTAGTPAGIYYWHVRAIDATGNSTEWTAPWKITVDNTAPVATIVSPLASSTVKNTVEVKGTVSDANPMNSYFVITGPGGYNKSSFFGDGRTIHTYNWDTTTALNGVYKIQFETRDKAGNKDATSTTSVLVTVNNPAPTLNTEDFGVGSWTLNDNGFTAYNVGFNIHDFKTVNNINVGIYNDSGLVATNTSSASLIQMINAGDSKVLPSLSTPFITQGLVSDGWCNGVGCWNLSPASSWTHTSGKPTKTIITVTGTDLHGVATTRTAENTMLSEAAATYQSILPAAVPTGANDGTNEPNNIGGGQASASANSTPALVRTAPTTPFVAAVDTSTNDGASDAAVLGATDTKKVSTSANDTPLNDSAVLGTKDVKNTNLAWYWWVLAAAVIFAFIWWIIARRSNQDN